MRPGSCQRAPWRPKPPQRPAGSQQVVYIAYARQLVKPKHGETVFAIFGSHGWGALPRVDSAEGDADSDGARDEEEPESTARLLSCT